MTKEELNKLPNGQHAWVLLEDQLLVVMKEDKYFYVCGAWEGGISNRDIELINKPK